MRARSVLGRGGAPVVWWALEGALLLEHVEVVRFRNTPLSFFYVECSLVRRAWSGI